MRGGLTEPGAGSDLSGIQATATRDGDDWLLNGEKWFVTSEGEPGVYIVLATAAGEQTLFLGDPGTEGLEIWRTPGFFHDPYLDRIWEGTSEIQRSIVSRGVFKRGAAPYLGWN